MVAQEIFLSRCENGLLVDVTDLEAFRDGLETAGSNPSLWKTWSNNGVEGVSRHFSWDAHVCNYIALMQKRLEISCTSTLDIWKY